MLAKQSFVWKVAGAAGEGIMTTGLLFSKTCARHGLYIFDYTEYPSLIRGGHNTYQVHTATDPVFAQKNTVDLLIALNKEGIELHLKELSTDSLLVFDTEHQKIEPEKYNLKAKLLDLPMIRLAKESGGEEVMANNVALGASVYLAGLDLTVLNQIITEVFIDKGPKIINLNQQAAQRGYEFVKSKYQPLFTAIKQETSHLTMTGNEAIALGALAGGLQFYAAYPMTPSSSILHFLAAKAREAKIVVKHAEDEISVVNMAIGASFAGARAMVGTSGGGFCYMVEALGLAGIAELPLVIVESQRAGPALGLPTWTAQGDLKFVINASHGEFPRIVLAPGDAKEAFELARLALILAEKYQIPVILLSDKYLSESRFNITLEATTFANNRFGLTTNPAPDQTGFFPRYKLADSPVSLRSTPGTTGGTYIANADEHDEYGLSNEDSNMRTAQVAKRQQKLKEALAEIPFQFWQEEPKAVLTFISFGSTKGPIQGARQTLAGEGIATCHLNLSWIWPFPKDQVQKIVTSYPNVLVVEGNNEGQLASLIAEQTGFMMENKLNRYDGSPFYPEEIVDYVKHSI